MISSALTLIGMSSENDVNFHLQKSLEIFDKFSWQNPISKLQGGKSALPHAN